jgi:sensor histidine kinase YesM
MKQSLLLLFALSSFLLSFGENYSSDLDLMAKKQIKTRFQFDDLPRRYYANILIRIEGDPSKEDSLIFNELVTKLKSAVDEWTVSLTTSQLSNLVVEINNPERKGEMNKIIGSRIHNGEIFKRTIILNLPNEMHFFERKKVIYYFILRSLVVFKDDESKAEQVPGSVFTESRPEQITFHPVDFKIIEKIYSKEVEDQYNYRYRSNNSGWKTQISSFLVYLAFFLSLSLIIFFVGLGKFKNHRYQFIPFIKQGMLVVLAFIISNVIYAIFAYIYLPKSASLPVVVSLTIFGSFIFGSASILIIFIIERALLKRKDNTILKVLVPFSTALLMVVILFLIRLEYAFSSQTSYLFMVSSSANSFILIAGIGRAFYIYMAIQSESIIRKKDLEIAQMNELQKQAELQSLRAKINPHFLYNALNSIASLATTDAQKTEQMALALSDFFKYAINRDQKQLNTISEELNATRTYLEIEKVRFGDRLNFEIDCPSEFLEIQIPQLLIQPLVENAIKHGLSKITEKGNIKISLQKQGNYLQIRVYDNGPSFPEEPLTGFGIRNTQERISLLYGEKASINWVNGKAKYIEIRLPL